MAWQDELNSLDQDLSAGRIRPEEYRRRRDELLAAASSAPAHPIRTPRASIANAFTSNIPEQPGEVTQRVEVPATAWTTQAPEAEPRFLAQGPPPPMQGPEVFGLAVAAPSTARPWRRYVIALVVLALLGAATWWIVGRDGSDEPAAQAPPRPTGGFTLESLPNPTDVPLSTVGVLSIDQAQVYNLIRPDEAAYLAKGDIDKIYFRTIVTGNLSYQMFGYKTRTPEGASRIMTGSLDRGKGVGMTKIAIDGLPPSVTVTKILVENAAIYEAVYLADGGAVRFLILQTGPNAEQQLANAFKHTAELVVGSIKPK